MISSQYLQRYYFFPYYFNSYITLVINYFFIYQIFIAYGSEILNCFIIFLLLLIDL